MKALVGVAFFLAYAGHFSAASAETVNYTYDSKGRLVRVLKINSTYSQVDSKITYDKANNRQRVNTTTVHR